MLQYCIHNQLHIVTCNFAVMHVHVSTCKLNYFRCDMHIFVYSLPYIKLCMISLFAEIIRHVWQVPMLVIKLIYYKVSPVSGALPPDLSSFGYLYPSCGRFNDCNQIKACPKRLPTLQWRL